MQAAVGDRCEIVTADDTHIDAEVVGFAGTNLFLMPTGDIHGLKPGARVLPRIGTGTVGVGPALLGRVVDGACAPLDGRGPIAAVAGVRLTGTPINPLARRRISAIVQWAKCPQPSAGFMPRSLAAHLR